jgi:purine-binding chemotaxis protein CheW
MANTAVVDSAQSMLDDLRGRYLTFNIGEVSYGLELYHVIEIIGMQPITKVPNLPDYIKGITNLRGRVVPIIDVRLKFGQPERDYDDKTCIIVTTIDDMNVGLIVDEVSDVITLDEQASAPPPGFGAASADRYLSSIAQVGDRVVMNIDIVKFFQNDLPQ